MKPTVHPLTQKQIDGFLKYPSHAVILVGPRGIGKLTLAINIAEKILDLKPGSFINFAFGLVISPGGQNSIGIEDIRQLVHFLSLKVPSSGSFNRIIIIEDSHLMTAESQNALLKTLEEPPKGTILILTAAQEQKLLPTIRSRAQFISIRRPAREALLSNTDQFKSNEKQLEQIFAISDGRPGFFASLLADADHPLWDATVKARQLLNQTAFQRLLGIDDLIKQKPLTKDLLFILQQMAHISMASGKPSRRWQSVLQSSYQTADALEHNAQAKLALTNLLLQL